MSSLKLTSKANSKASFVVADMADPLPFQRAALNVVMSNVAAHMFSDRVTRALFAEVHRVFSAQGLFLFYVNAIEDRLIRARWKREVRELEDNYILEQDGLTMHFFSKACLLELLSGWQKASLEFVTIPIDTELGYPAKRVWRVIAHR